MDLEAKFNELLSELKKTQDMIASIKPTVVEDELVTTQQAMARLNMNDPETFRNYCRRHGIDAKINGRPKRYSLKQILLRA